MKTKDHLKLGKHVLQQSKIEISSSANKAFLLGCIEPDYNPLTYMRGWRVQHFRGHNYCNNQNYIERLIKRLHHRDNWRLKDYFKFGQLVHYLTDAFTYAHNSNFDGNLYQHKGYEKQLHLFFAKFHPQKPNLCPGVQALALTNGGIDQLHLQYMTLAPSMLKDICYAFSALEFVAKLLPLSPNLSSDELFLNSPVAETADLNLSLQKSF